MGFKPAIVTVGYNRTDSIKRLWESLENASYDSEDVVLIASIDKSDKSDEISNEFEKFKWSHGTKRLISHSANLGLRKHIISCGDLTEEYGSVIILEDDLIVSPEFYRYATSALDYYGNCEKICGVSLYSHSWNGYVDCEFIPEFNGYDVYWGQFSITWGQCWTKKTWNGFREWYFKNQTFTRTARLPEQVYSWGDKSWGKYYFKYIVENDLYYIIPYVSLSTNCSAVGEHCNISNSAHQVPLVKGKCRDLVFPDQRNAIKYDAYFERILDNNITISGISGNEICIDLNASKQDNAGKPYLLTTRALNYPIKSTYGIDLRPIEENVLLQMPGDDIFLYITDEKEMQLKKNSQSMNRFGYEAYGLRWNKMIQYGFYLFGQKVMTRVRKVIQNAGNKK